MDDLRITLSDAESAFLDEQAVSEGHASAEDYATALVRAELKAKAQEKLEGLLLEGLEGEDEQWGPALMDEIREEARRGSR